MKHLNTNKFEPTEFDWSKTNSSNSDSNPFKYFNPLEKLKLKRKRNILKIIFQFISISIWIIGFMVSIKYVIDLF